MKREFSFKLKTAIWTLCFLYAYLHVYGKTAEVFRMLYLYIGTPVDYTLEISYNNANKIWKNAQAFCTSSPSSYYKQLVKFSLIFL